MLLLKGIFQIQYCFFRHDRTYDSRNNIYLENIGVYVLLEKNNKKTYSELSTPSHINLWDQLNFFHVCEIIKYNNFRC